MKIFAEQRHRLPRALPPLFDRFLGALEFKDTEIAELRIDHDVRRFSRKTAA
jgi:hypothetical protein